MDVGTIDATVLRGRERVGEVEHPRDVTFEELYRQDFRRLVALAYGLSGSRAAAEELVQEAFLAAHRRWDQIRDYDNPSAWLRRVVVNRSISAIRRRVAEGVALARVFGRRQLPEALPEPDEAVWRAVRRLPKRQAQVIALRYVDDLPVAEIATILGCAEGTVKSNLHHARNRLAELLGSPTAADTDTDAVDPVDIGTGGPGADADVDALTITTTPETGEGPR